MYKIVCGNNTGIYSDLEIAIRAYTRPPYVGDHIHIDRCINHTWEVLGEAAEEDSTVYWMRNIERLDYIIEDDFLYSYTGTVNDQEVTNIKQYLEDLALDAALQAQRAENQRKLNEIAARKSEALNKVKYLSPVYSGQRLGTLVYYRGAIYEIVQINSSRYGFSVDLFARYDKQWLPIGISPQGRVNNVMATEFTEV